MTTDDDPEWLTVDEVAAVFRIGKTSVYELVRTGSLPARRFGKLLRFHRSVLDWPLTPALTRTAEGNADSAQNSANDSPRTRESQPNSPKLR